MAAQLERRLAVLEAHKPGPSRLALINSLPISDRAKTEMIECERAMTARSEKNEWGKLIPPLSPETMRELGAIAPAV